MRKCIEMRTKANKGLAQLRLDSIVDEAFDTLLDAMPVESHVIVTGAVEAALMHVIARINADDLMGLFCASAADEACSRAERVLAGVMSTTSPDNTN